MDDFKMPSSNAGRDAAKRLMGSDSKGAAPSTQKTNTKLDKGSYSKFAKGGKAAKPDMKKMMAKMKKEEMAEGEPAPFAKGGKSGKTKCYAKGGKVAKIIPETTKTTTGQQVKPTELTGMRKGGKAKKYAMGGAGKIRKGVADKSGKPNPNAC